MHEQNVSKQALRCGTSAISLRISAVSAAVFSTVASVTSSAFSIPYGKFIPVIKSDIVLPL